MTIKEVEQHLEIPRATVRFYEKEGLLQPERSENGYRTYSPEDITRLKQIIVFRKLGMKVTDIEDVLDGARPLSEVVADSILSLEEQMEQLKGAITLCRRMQEEKEELETFEVDKYWNAIEEEEKKGNRFLDIAKDMAHYEKSIILEYFGIADINGNLSVSLPKALKAIVLTCGAFVIMKCILADAWTWQNVLYGIGGMLMFIAIELVIGIPIFLVGRKRPEVLKKRNKIMLILSSGVLLILMGLIIFALLFGE